MKKDVKIMIDCFFKDIVSNIRLYLLKTLSFYPFCFLFVWKNVKLSDLEYLFCLISLVVGVGAFWGFYYPKVKKWFLILGVVCMIAVLWMCNVVNKYYDFEHKAECLQYDGKWDNNVKKCVSE